MIINSNTINKNRLINIELWTNDNVCEWLKGAGEKAELYVDNFRDKNICGKKLTILDDSDLIDIGIEIIDHRIVLLNLIKNLVQIRHDLNNETLHTLVFNTKNRVIYILNYIDKLFKCINCNYSVNDNNINNFFNPCKICTKTENDICRLISSLSTSYRRLLSWLAKLPFTRIKTIDGFRNDLNCEMKNLLKLFRKRSKVINFYDNLKFSLNKILDYCSKFLDTCDTIGEDEYDKNTIIFNYCYLEKVIIRKKTSEQILGITLTNLLGGIFTVAEIAKESASDECSRISVGDDIFAINDQIIIGWNNTNVYKLLENIHSTTNSFVLLLRKMPRDHVNTLKQQRFINNLSTLPRDKLKRSVKDARKHSFADVFLSDQDLLDVSSDDDDDDKPLYGHTLHRNNLRQSIVENRKIQSMHNLIINNSRSNSADALDNITTNDDSSQLNNSIMNSKIKKERNKSSDSDSTKADSVSKSDIFRSLFLKRWDFSKIKKLTNQSSIEVSEPSTPNLINVKRLDSNGNESIQTLTPPPITNCYGGSNHNGTNGKPPTLASKPPIDKKTNKHSKPRPIYQSWLFKRKPADKSNNTIIRTINPKWQRYYCLLMKDHILFNKQPDDRTPKDFIYLKNFSIIKTDRKFSFKLIDHNKNNAEHDFYAENWEEFRDWWQYLNEFSTKQNCNGTNLSTIENNSIKTENSSHESSPLASPSSKIASRENSPSLTYPNQAFKTSNTSESECETDTSKHQSTASLASSNTHVSVPPKYSSQFSLPQTLSHKFEKTNSTRLDNLKRAKELTKNTELPSSFGIYNTIESNNDSHRCNSLPGSLQACVGSYLNERQTRKPLLSSTPKSTQPPVSFKTPITTTNYNNNQIAASINTITNTTPLSNIIQISSKQTNDINYSRASTLPSPVTPPNNSLLSNYSRSPLLNVSTNSFNNYRQSPTQVKYIKKPSSLVSTAALTDSIPLTPPLTPIPNKFNQTLYSPQIHSQKYRTEITILPSFSNGNNTKINK